MPVLDCGYPLTYNVQTHTGDPVKIFSGRQLLIAGGASISAEVGFDGKLFEDPSTAGELAKQLASGAAASPVLKTTWALVDTGAQESCIDEELARDLNLPVIDIGKCAGVGGTHDVNIYLGHIRIPALNFVRWGRFMGVKLSQGGQGHQALIGRNLLASMVLIYDGRTGSVTLAV